MSDTAVTIMLDRERLLDVRPQLMELERVTGVGIGRLVSRVIAGEYHAADLSETVRLGLIGGGTPPAEAANLARVYISERPLAEGHGLATGILLGAWNGTKRAAAEIALDLTAEAGELILDATGKPMRVENDGSLTPVRRAAAGTFEAA